MNVSNTILNEPITTPKLHQDVTVGDIIGPTKPRPAHRQRRGEGLGPRSRGQIRIRNLSKQELEQEQKKRQDSLDKFIESGIQQHHQEEEASPKKQDSLHHFIHFGIDSLHYHHQRQSLIENHPQQQPQEEGYPSDESQQQQQSPQKQSEDQWRQKQRPSIDELRANLKRKCQEASSRRLSLRHSSPAKRSFDFRPSLNSTSEEGNSNVGYSLEEDSLYFITDLNGNHGTDSNPKRGSSSTCRSSSNTATTKRISMEQIRNSIMNSDFLQRCISYDVDCVDVDEQRYLFEQSMNNINSQESIMRNKNDFDDDDDGYGECPDCQPGKICLACDPGDDGVPMILLYPQVEQLTSTVTAATSFEEEQQISKSEPPSSDIVAEEDVVIFEVAPGIRMSLKSIEDTWSAVMEGRITVTACTSCQCELTCSDDAEVVVCTDCWVFSPVDQTESNMEATATTSDSANTSSMVSNAFENIKPEEQEKPYGDEDGRNGDNDNVEMIGSIDVGIKAETIFEWLECQGSGPAS